MQLSDRKVKIHDNIINRETREIISRRYKKITKAINYEFWNINSEDKNTLYVGSYGRNTSISSSDIDVLSILPRSEFDKYNNLTGNSQSKFLQAVKKSIIDVYPNSDIKADGQVIIIKFTDGIILEILPTFKKLDGSFMYPDTNGGGFWKSTNPKSEQEELKKKNNLSNGLLIATCRHIRFIRDNYFSSYYLSGIVIDSFVYHAIGNWHYSSKTSNVPHISYEQNLLDYYQSNFHFLKLMGIKAPGSNDVVSVEKSMVCLEKVLKYMVGN